MTTLRRYGTEGRQGEEGRVPWEAGGRTTQDGARRAPHGQAGAAGGQGRGSVQSVPESVTELIQDGP